jgi:hypothetical protein
MDVFQLKVTLKGTRPPIWRRLLVPSNLTLGQLHYVLQTAMGWTDSHLHEFRIGGRSYGKPDPEYQDFGLPPSTNEDKVRLSTVLARVGAKAVYNYDFGDDWQHEIVLEKRLPSDPKLSYPRCTGGKRACPPEDCGGLGGFYNFLEAISDPAHESHEELIEWSGGDYDPEAFSADSVNRRLGASLRPNATIQ